MKRSASDADQLFTTVRFGCVKNILWVDNPSPTIIFR